MTKNRYKASDTTSHPSGCGLEKRFAAVWSAFLRVERISPIFGRDLRRQIELPLQSAREAGEAGHCAYARKKLRHFAKEARLALKEAKRLAEYRRTYRGDL